MKWKKIGGFWNPQKAKDEISGKLLRVNENVGDYDSLGYVIETEEEILIVMGATVLDRKMKEAIREGDFVKIVFLGEKEGEKAKYKDFDIFKGIDK